VHEGGRFEIHEDATTIRDDVVKSRAGRRTSRLNYWRSQRGAFITVD
jgi:hypothetical protein